MEKVTGLPLSGLVESGPRVGYHSTSAGRRLHDRIGLPGQPVDDWLNNTEEHSETRRLYRFVPDPSGVLGSEVEVEARRRGSARMSTRVQPAGRA